MKIITKWIRKLNDSLDYGILGDIIVPSICGIVGSFIGMLIAKLIGIL